MAPELPVELIEHIKRHVTLMTVTRETRPHRASIAKVRLLSKKLLKLLDLVGSQRSGFGSEAYDDNDVLDTLNVLADVQQEYGGLELDMIVEALDDLVRYSALAKPETGRAGRTEIQSWKYAVVYSLADFWTDVTGESARPYFLAKWKTGEEGNSTAPANEASKWIADKMSLFKVPGLSEITTSELETILKHYRRRQSLKS